MRRPFLFCLPICLFLCLFPASALRADGLDDALAALRSGDSAGAIASLQKALAAPGELARGTARYAEALSCLITLESRSAQKKLLLEQFIADYAGHARWSAHSWDLYHIYLGEDAYADALRVVLPLRDRADTRERALAALAVVSLELGRAEESLSYLASFFREFGQSPLAPRMLLCRAELCQMRGDPAGAKKDYDDILAKYPRDPAAAAAWFALAELAGNAGDLRQARAYLDRLIAEFPRSFEAGLARGRRLILAAEEKPTREVRVWEVQLAAFFARAQAERFVAELSAKGYLSFVDQETVNEKVQYSVRMGYFRARSDAEIVLKELAEKGYPGFIRTRTVFVAEDDLG